MTRPSYTGFTLCALCAFAAGCSSVTGRPQRSPEADKIAVYEAVPADPRPYRLLKRVWVEPWRSAFTVPKYGTIEAGAADLQNQAIALGGDAVMNFGCYRLDAGIPPGSPVALVCNGNVIRYER